MKISVQVRIIIAIVLPLIIFFFICRYAISNHLSRSGAVEAMRITENYAFYLKNLFNYTNINVFEISAEDDIFNIHNGNTRGINLILVSDHGTVINSSGQELAGHDLISLVLGKNPIKAVEGLSEFIRYNASGSEYYAAEYNSLFRDGTSFMSVARIAGGIPGQDFFVFMDIPSDILLTPYDTSVRIVLYYALGGIITIMIAVFIVTRGIAKPLAQMNRAALRAAGGDYDVRFTPFNRYTKDEVTLLGNSLDKMNEEFRLKSKAAVHQINSYVKDEKKRGSSDVRANFLAKISHEIRTPMNSILGIAQILLADSGAERLSEAQKKYIGDIKVSADSLLHVINDLLDLSKLTAGKMPLSMHDYNLPQLIDNIDSIAKFMVTRKGLEYKFSVNGELPLCLYGDDVRIRQVLVNLINNAVKFTEKGFVSVTVTVESDVISYEIRDSGRGIKSENIEGLFDAYEYVGSSLSGTSTVLGLPISKKLAELMHGDVSVASEYGVGSVFTVTLPVTPGDENNLSFHAHNLELYFSRDTRILVVDDNEINLEVAKGLIWSLYGIDCDLAGSGPEALALVERNKYDLIFMDHMMPGMDGAQTTHRIREMGGTRVAVPIVALTANTVIGTKDLLLRGGMNDFLSKPIIVEEMNEVLRKWLPKDKRILKDEQPPAPEAVKPDAAEAEHSAVITAAMNIAGLDVSAGLANVANKEKVYENSLRLLLNKIPKVSADTERYLDENNIEDFTILVHGMKTSLATVGAAELSKSALELERAGKENNIALCREKLPAFIEPLTKLGEQLGGALGGAPEANRQSDKHTGGEQLGVLLSKLETAAMSFDYEAIQSIINELKGKA
jgi:signal transduction histidine kinase/DNA-binding response OmpR family regulator